MVEKSTVSTRAQEDTIDPKHATLQSFSFTEKKLLAQRIVFVGTLYLLPQQRQIIYFIVSIEDDRIFFIN